MNLEGLYSYFEDWINHMMAENEAAEEEKPKEEQNDIPLAGDELDEETAVELDLDLDGEEETDESEVSQPTEKPEQGEQRKRRRTSPALRQMTSWFAACGRCSFFLAGYRLICDEEALETAVANRGKKWLVVPWSQSLAELVHKTYGSRIDISCYHFEGQCLECHRRYTYQAAEQEEEPASFRIELKP